MDWHAFVVKCKIILSAIAASNSSTNSRRTAIATIVDLLFAVLLLLFMLLLLLRLLLLPLSSLFLFYRRAQFIREANKNFHIHCNCFLVVLPAYIFGIFDTSVNLVVVNGCAILTFNGGFEKVFADKVQIISSAKVNILISFKDEIKFL